MRLCADRITSSDRRSRTCAAKSSSRNRTDSDVMLSPGTSPLPKLCTSSSLASKMRATLPRLMGRWTEPTLQASRCRRWIRGACEGRSDQIFELLCRGRAYDVDALACVSRSALVQCVELRPRIARTSIVELLALLISCRVEVVPEVGCGSSCVESRQLNLLNCVRRLDETQTARAACHEETDPVGIATLKTSGTRQASPGRCRAASTELSAASIARTRRPFVATRAFEAAFSVVSNFLQMSTSVPPRSIRSGVFSAAG